MEKIVYVDVTNSAKLVFILDDGLKIIKTEKKGERLNFLLELTSFLKKKKIEVKNLSCLVLLEGEGSFSGVRQATAVLNILKLGGGLRIFGLDKRKNNTEDLNFFNKTRQLLKDKKTDFLKPIYSGEPNITKPRTS